MDLEKLFCWTMADLQAINRSTWHYHQLRAAGLLRLLLLDNTPLVDRVNRQHRLKLRFKVGATLRPIAEYQQRGQPSGLDVSFSMMADPVDPEMWPGHPLPSQEVDRDKLLQLVLLELNNEPMTSRDLIRHMAYVSGVIHADEPEDAVDTALLAARSTLRLSGSPAGFPTLRGLSNVVFRGLVPLRDAVLAKHNFGQQLPEFDYG